MSPRATSSHQTKAPVIHSHLKSLALFLVTATTLATSVLLIRSIRRLRHKTIPSTREHIHFISANNITSPIASTNLTIQNVSVLRTVTSPIPSSPNLTILSLKPAPFPRSPKHPVSVTNINSPFATPNSTISSTKPRHPFPVPAKQQKDLFFTPSTPTKLIKASHPLSPPCVIFSCSGQGYFLIQPNLRVHKARLCDRMIFTGRTTDETGKTVSSQWCRIALLRVAGELFGAYHRVIYTDLDIVYSEYGFTGLRCGERLKGIVLSYKVEKGVTIMRTPWIVFCDLKDGEVLRMVAMWALKHRNVYLNDQRVLNENWGCGDLTCFKAKNKTNTHIRHCGSWMSKEERVKCMLKR